MFVHINKKVNFTDELKSKYVNSIVFIKDTQEIWTHDTFYAIPEEYKNKISELEQKVGGSLIFLTQEEYDLLGTDIKKDAVYIITNDTPELKIQGPFIAENGLLTEASSIENYQHYVFKVNNDYFFIYKDEFDISLPNDPSLYKQITGNFEILQAGTGNSIYEYCVPEVVNIESLDDIGMESLLRDTVIVDSFESYGSVAMSYNKGGFYSDIGSESGTFYGFYVNSIPANISLNSDKGLRRFYQGQDGYITYNFPNTLCTYQVEGHNVLIQQCLNRNNAQFHKYVQNIFTSFKTDCNIEEVEFIGKSTTIYDKELNAIGKKINLDLSNRLDFGIDSNIIVGRIIKFKYRELRYYRDVERPMPNPSNYSVRTIDNTNNIYWLDNNDDYLVLVNRGDKIIPEPPSVVKLRIKDDLSIFKYNSIFDYNEFPRISIENIENFNDNDVSEFLSNIIVPAVDGVQEVDDGTVFMNYSSNPYSHQSEFPKQDATIYSSNLHTGLKIGKGNPDITNTYEYRFSEFRSTFNTTAGASYKLYYSPITVPGDNELQKYEYSIDDIIKSYVTEVISTGKYKRLVYNINIGFNCPSYIIPSLYYYLHLDLPSTNKVIDSVELIAPSNCKYDTFIKALEATYNIDLSNRFSYDEGTISNYMLLYVKTKTMN